MKNSLYAFALSAWLCALPAVGYSMVDSAVSLVDDENPVVNQCVGVRYALNPKSPEQIAGYWVKNLCPTIPINIVYCVKSNGDAGATACNRFGYSTVNNLKTFPTPDGQGYMFGLKSYSNLGEYEPGELFLAEPSARQGAPSLLFLACKTETRYTNWPRTLHTPTNIYYVNGALQGSCEVCATTEGTGHNRCLRR